MKYLALLTPVAGRSMGDFQPHILAEEKVVWAMYAAGVIRELYFQPEPLRVSLVFEATGNAQVEAHLATLPMIKAGLLAADVIALGPWLMFEELFDPANKSRS